MRKLRLWRERRRVTKKPQTVSRVGNRLEVYGQWARGADARNRINKIP